VGPIDHTLCALLVDGKLHGNFFEWDPFDYSPFFKDQFRLESAFLYIVSAIVIMTGKAAALGRDSPNS
jgi:hypothetical protein